MKFSDTGIQTEHILGRKIEMLDVIGKEILIEKVMIGKSKFEGRNKTGLRMQMQLVLDGIGEPNSCFTGSDVLIRQMQRAIEKHGDALFPLETVIVKSGKCLMFA